ncbi:hypothetical protein [Silvanigrella aquatica]|uniref:Uncharacterized protein n=1 Tax=Silvanigrella aquatica TaxID=1915309 RepID=A0A1L4D4W4_9BACT|nr:hypothetical protein [Silvanigrella aquatica]APJ05255.1 hypothetical protein AXG55_14630 [Silvanigrella aquatica]
MNHSAFLSMDGTGMPFVFSGTEKDISNELKQNLTINNVKNVYKNKIIDLIDHIEYSIPLNIISSFEILSAIELLNNKIIYGNLDEDCVNKIVQHSHYNIQNFLKLNYDLEYINRDFDKLNYDSKKLVLDDVLLEYKADYFGIGVKKDVADGFVFGNIKRSNPRLREIFLKKLINCDLCKNIFKEYEYFRDKYARDILTIKLKLLDKKYFLVEEFENLQEILTKDNIINKKLIDIFNVLERASFLVDEYKLEYRIPSEYIEILDNRIENNVLTEEEKSYLDNPYNPLILDMIGCKFKIFSSKNN